ncbi:MAG TPA: hypothetical protein VGN34_11040 [Ktedonobacteraceae bacterium]
MVRRKKLQLLSLCVGVAALAAFLLIQNGPVNATNKVAATWKVVASPNPASVTNILNGLTVLTPNNAWAVGSALDKVHGNQTLIEHWDGKKWTVIASPTPNIFITHAGHLASVAAAGPNDVWAVGEYINSVLGSTHTLIEHWNGRQWGIVPSPNPGSFLNTMSSITTLAPNNIWATGTYSSAKDGSTRAMILHWNGKAWSVIATPAPANFSNLLNNITAVAPNNIWAVGAMVNKQSNSAQSQVLIEHWNGAHWSRVAGPALPRGASGAFLQGISRAPGNKLIWAVGGYYKGGQSRLSTLIEVWNGKKWTIIASPNRSNIDNMLMSVTATAANSIWAVGGTSKNGPGQSLIEHWDGARWTIVNNPNPGPSTTVHFLTSIMYIPGNKHIWCVGFYGDGTKAATLTELFG